MKLGSIEHPTSIIERRILPMRGLSMFDVRCSVFDVSSVSPA